MKMNKILMNYQKPHKAILNAFTQRSLQELQLHVLWELKHLSFALYFKISIVFLIFEKFWRIRKVLRGRKLK